VALRHHDRRVTEHVLERFEPSARLEPATGEGVAQLMRVKALHPAVPPHLPREAPAAAERQQPADPQPELGLKLLRERHAAHLARLRVVNN